MRGTRQRCLRMKQEIWNKIKSHPEYVPYKRGTVSGVTAWIKQAVYDKLELTEKETVK